MASWSILPTTADVGFLAEGENIVELFKISALALQSIRYGFPPGAAISYEEGEQITFSISRSDREDRDLLSLLEEVNWLSESESSMFRIISVSISDDQILSEAVKFKIDEFELIKEPKNCKSNYWLQTLILNKPSLKLQKYILEETNKKGFGTRPVWNLLNKNKHLKKFPSMNLKKANNLEKRIINLPSSPFLCKV